jgi:hypothetical protein
MNNKDKPRRKPDAERLVTVAVGLLPHEVDAIKALAAKQNISRSLVIKNIIRERLKL